MADPLAPEALTSINALLRHMEEEASLFQELSRLLERQREALKEVGAPRLGAVREETERLLSLLDRVAEARSESLAAVARHLGMEADAVTVGALLERLPGHSGAAHELEALRGRLRGITEEVRRRGETAQHLLEVSLETLHAIFALVQQETTEGLYGGEGAV
ncbi:MAG: flagellar protein FlgN, partial [Nitrospirae bacterium]